MSSSFLKPEVTPCTALATSARAKPCRARCSSVERLATSVPSLCSKVMPRGTATESFPFGPCTSTLPPSSAIFTPWGTAIGLFPIRDICLSLSLTGAPPARRAAAHHASRGGQNADAQAAHHRPNLRHAKVGACAGPGNPPQAADDAAAVGRVLQENAQHFARLVLIHQLVRRNVTLFLQNARDFRLELGDRNIDALVLGGRRVAEARQEIGNGIGLHDSPTSWLSPRPGFPRAAPCRENRCGTSETCEYSRALGRRRGSGCACGP